MGCGCSTKNDEESGLNNKITIFEASKLTDINLKYELLSILGHGGFGKVRLFRDRSCPDMKYAIKTMSKIALKPEVLNYLKLEIKILRELDHPNIVKYIDCYEDDRYLHIVMEYIPGDDLFKVITHRKFNNFTEADAADMIENLLKAVLFLHNKNIVHRDIKPENILFSIQGQYQSLKLIDFGLATRNLSKMNYIVGSPHYIAPEMLEGKPDLKSDIWSIGVIIFVMLTGKRPFEGKNQIEVFRLIKNCDFDHIILKEANISDEAKDLILKLLVIDLEKRLSTSEALKHQWFEKFKKKENTIEKSSLETSILKSLKSFTKANLLKKEILYILAKLSSDIEIFKLREAFMQFDKDNTGTIEFEEIYGAFKKIGFEPKEGEIKEIWDNLDFHNDGTVNYTEFLAATISSQKFFKEEKLWIVFKYFDVGNEGSITAESVTEALKLNNITVDENEINRIFEKIKNTKSNKKLNFEEFKNLMESC